MAMKHVLTAGFPVYGDGMKFVLTLGFGDMSVTVPTTESAGKQQSYRKAKVGRNILGPR